MFFSLSIFMYYNLLFYRCLDQYQMIPLNKIIDFVFLSNSKISLTLSDLSQVFKKKDKFQHSSEYFQIYDTYLCKTRYILY